MATVSTIESNLALTYGTNRGPQVAEASVSMTSFNRPADTTAYTAGDVVTDSTGAAKALAFPNCGRGGLIVNAQLVVAHTATADFDLLVFESEPTNFLDNAALALVAADQPKLLGIFRFVNGTKVNVGTNLELYRATSAGTDQALPPVAYTTAGATGGILYGHLVVRIGYTPLSANKFTLRLGLQRNGG